jgi:hypothetical protein
MHLSEGQAVFDGFVRRSLFSIEIEQLAPCFDLIREARNDSLKLIESPVGEAVLAEDAALGQVLVEKLAILGTQRT